MRDQQRSAPRIAAKEFQELAWQGVPFVRQLGWRLERFAPGDVVVRLPYSELLLRPGGTICGPALMALADITLYGLVLSMIGRVEGAVTTNLSVHFLSRPAPADVLAAGRILRMGRRLAVGEVIMHTSGIPARSATSPAPTRSRRRTARGGSHAGTAFRTLQSM